MAAADTAALVASLELKDQFSATARKFDQTVTGMERSTSTLGRIGGQVSQGIGTAVHNIALLGAVGVGILATQVAQGIQSLQRLEEVNAATAAVIKSTGGVAGVTAQQVRDLAEQFESLNATMDDKVIQSAENVLLTFTAIGEEAFPVALQAALDMNQALGGGEEGLQGTIIQVGKALQDPIRGLTALRRVGVNFTKAQEDQIKALVKANRLYDAQQIILGELGREFGGQFAAAGDTAAGKFAKLKDAIEDSQMALATAFLPVLVTVADKLTEFLSDPATQQGIKELGSNLAEGFDALIQIAGELPWDVIGDAFRLMGTGSKALLDAFVGLPPWVQTAVLTGWGLNKLTGGALTGIAGALASGLIKGVLGINAGVVNINAATVNGGVGGGVGGGAAAAAGGGAAALLGAVGVGVVFTAIAVAIGEAVAQNITRPLDPTGFDFNAVAGASGKFTTQAASDRFAQGLAERLGIPLQQVEQGITSAVLGEGLTFDQAVARLITQSGEQHTEIVSRDTKAGQDQAVRDKENQGTLALIREGTIRTYTATETGEQGRKNQAAAAAAAAATALQTQAQSLMNLQTIAGKDFSPTVAVTVTSNVTISDIQRKITSQQIAIGRGPQEF